MNSTVNERLKKLALNIKKNPDDSFSKFALALEFQKLNYPDKALVLFESIHENDPGYVGVYYHLGNMYRQKGHVEKAKTIFEEGISVAEEQNELHAKSELQSVLMELEIEEYE